MKNVALLLQKYREARRDVLLAKATRQQRLLAEADRARAAADADHRAACAMKLSAPAGGGDLMQQREFVESVRPALDALIARRAALCETAASRWREARTQCDEARKAVQHHERALLRGEQLIKLLRDEEQRVQAIAESLDDDDLATARAWQG